MTVITRWARRVAAVALTSAAVAVTAPSSPAAVGAEVPGTSGPAPGQDPPLVVTPSAEPGVVDVTVNVAAEALHLCDAAVGSAPDRLAVYRFCQDWYVPIGPPVEPGQPVVVPMWVDEPLVSMSGDVLDCGDTPHDCAVLAGPYSLSRTEDFNGVHTATFSHRPPTLAVTPSTGIVDGSDVAVFLHGPAGATWTVATCAANHNWETGRLDVTARCAPATGALLDSDGQARLSVTIDAALAGEGVPIDCRESGEPPSPSPTTCAVVVRGPDGAVVASRAVLVRAPLGVRISPSVGLGPIPAVYGEVIGRRDTFLGLYQCAAAVTGPEGLDGPCVDVGTPWVPEVLPGSRHQQVDPVLRPTFIGVDDTSVDCRTAPGACVFVVGAVGADQFASTPLAFAATALVPSTDLLDGQAMTITATGVTPGAGFRVVHCDDAHLPVAWTCEDPADAPWVAVDANGTLTATTEAIQRFTTVLERAAYCRDECAVLLLPDDESLADVRLRYELAGGEITAAPATGVIDGQEVTLSGSGLMDSYDGPAVGFLTSGVWGLGQCGRGVLDDPTVRGVFAHCTGAGPIEVAGGAVEAAVPVRSTFDPPTGPPVDCTATPDACVLVLARVEQDGTASLHSTAIALAPWSAD